MEQFKIETQSHNEAKKANEINLLSMIESRIMEIVNIEDECKRKLPKLFQQRLPRFMRRRAASHNVKRIPKRLRPNDLKSKVAVAKNRKTLLRYRRRLRFRKHKRIIIPHSRHKYKDINKSLLHKWFAKRFKMADLDSGHLAHVPLYNNTKNQRNLYRQTQYGCTYLSYGHFVAINIPLCRREQEGGRPFAHQIDQLNRLTCQVSGFTFRAKSLEKGNYEVVVHLYRIDKAPQEFVCSSYVSMLKPNKSSKENLLVIWLPRQYVDEVSRMLAQVSNACPHPFTATVVNPNKCMRIRLVGPHSRREAQKICEKKEDHELAEDQANMCIHGSLGATIGRLVVESWATFTYFATDPDIVDIVFKQKQGRLLWYKLIKNKAHLVGGHRDIERVLIRDCFILKPDCDKTMHSRPQEKSPESASGVPMIISN